MTPLGVEAGKLTMALFKIGLGAERAGLHTRCNESPAIMRAKSVARQELPDQTPPNVVVAALHSRQIRETPSRHSLTLGDGHS